MLLFENIPQSIDAPYGPDQENCLVEFCPATIYEVTNLLKTLTPNKPSCSDGISPIELNMAANVISVSLAVLFNESVASGKLPTDFKPGKILPLLKPGKSDSSLVTTAEYH